MLKELIEWGLNPEFCTPEFLASQGFSPTLPWRFIRKVNKNGPLPTYCPELGPCWIWTAGLINKGYGKVWGAFDYVLAHRASWILHHGPIAEGLCTLHKCDTPACVKPLHLRKGTRIENTQDMIAKHRNGFVRHCGENNGFARLTWQQICEIRSVYASGHISQQSLSELYRVDRTTIGLIVRGERWHAGKQLCVKRPGCSNHQQASPSPGSRSV